MKCPKCGKNIKAHAGGEKDFRELSLPQMKAAVAKTTRDLKEMRVIYQEQVAKASALSADEGAI